MPDRLTSEDEALLAELGVEAESTPERKYTPREERIIAGFEEIQRFVEQHGRKPEHGEDRDIFERLYAVRLDRIRALSECRELLAAFDGENLIGEPGSDVVAEISDDELLAELGVDATEGDDITTLKHVRPHTERKQPDEVARRTRCEDFGVFRPMFEKVQAELESGERKTVRYKQNPDNDADVRQGDLFIIDGVKAFVATMGEEFETEYERINRRLRVIFDNGTESNLLLRSLQRSLYKDANSRRILTGHRDQALFSDLLEEGDVETGYIYVLRSCSDHPFIAENRESVHKIGVTKGTVERRIHNAPKEPSYLLAEVDVVSSYRLANIDRFKLENLLHRFFDSARLDVQLKDRFGGNVEPREWFLVPLPAIDLAIQLLIEGRLESCRYDARAAQIVDADGRPVAANDQPS